MSWVNGSPKLVKRSRSFRVYQCSMWSLRTGIEGKVGDLDTPGVSVDGAVFHGAVFLGPRLLRRYVRFKERAIREYFNNQERDKKRQEQMGVGWALSRSSFGCSFSDNTTCSAGNS